MNTFDEDNADDQPYRSQETSNIDGVSSKKSRWGCVLWGCLGTLVVSTILLGIGSFFIYKFATSQVQKYTDTEPKEFPAIDASQEDVDAIQDRIEKFKVAAGLSQDDPTPTPQENTDDSTDDSTDDANIDSVDELVLTADEINTLIFADPNFSGKVYVEIEDDKLLARISYPTDGVPGGKGRFLNVDGQLKATMEDGILVVRLVDAKVKGEPLPSQFMDAITADNLAADLYEDPDTVEVLKRFDTIEVRDGAVRLNLKTKADPDSQIDMQESEAEMQDESEASEPSPTQ